MKYRKRDFSVLETSSLAIRPAIAFSSPVTAIKSNIDLTLLIVAVCAFDRWQLYLGCTGKFGIIQFFLNL
jgi:hypothetical protein